LLVPAMKLGAALPFYSSTRASRRAMEWESPTLGP
jgi:hypothetical protein